MTKFFKQIKQLEKAYNNAANNDDFELADNIQVELEDLLNSEDSFKLRIKTINQLKQLLKISEESGWTLEVRKELGNGIFTRKNIYSDFGCFNYVDESEQNFKNEKQAINYWTSYLKNNKLYYNGMG